MTISRKTEICGWSGLTHPDRHASFPAHDKRIRHFRQNHGGIAGVEAAVMMRLPLYVMPFIKDYGGANGLFNAMELPGFMVMKRPPLRILMGN